MDGLREGNMFAAVGLGHTEQLIYETLVGGTPATPAELGKTLAIGPRRIMAALASLESRGLASRIPGTPSRYSAVAPDLALDLLILEREEGLARLRRYAEELTASFHRITRSGDPAELIEVVTGKEAMSKRADHILRAARHEVRFIDRPPYAAKAKVLNPAEFEQLRRGVRFRGIYDPAGYELAHDVHDDLEAGIALGEEARVMPGAPIKLILADDRLGLVPLQASPTAIEAIVIVSSSGLLEALGALFELLWRHALPFTLPPGEAPAGSDLAPDELRVLAMLTSGLPDSAAAKQLGLSLRTYQRRVRALMTRLGAQTRFQAGAQAVQRGWLTTAERRAERSGR